MQGIATTLSDWRTLQRSRRLAAWRGWKSDNTSQSALMGLLSRYRRVLAFGGNRSGKTEWLRAVTLALVLGSDHPTARLFWERNGCNPEDFPTGPGKGYLVALTSNDSLRYHRGAVDALIPRLPGCAVQWWNRNGRGEARCEIRVPGYDSPAVLFFKAEDQGVDAMQGDSCRVISHDEEGGSEAVWNEAEVRLWDQKGWHLMANTPIKGRTWIYHRFVKDTPPDAACYWIHTLDNPFLPQDDARKLERMNTAIAAARLRGEFVQLKGRVWPAFSRGVHVVNRPTIPPDWPRYRSIDFGTRNPFVCLWGALDPDDTLWVYREHYQAGWTTSQHVEAIRGAEGWRRLDDGEAPPRVGAVLRSEWGTWVDDGSHEPIENTWADPEDPQQIAQLSMNHDLFITPAVRDVAAGVDAVAERLGARAIVISSECANTIREIEGYAWSEQAENTERPLKRDDHTCDCVRYLCMGVMNE